MIPIYTVFGVMMVFFGLIGSLRGWAKEIIVAFSVILALFVEHVLESFVMPLVPGLSLDALPAGAQFYARAVLFIIIIVFGYATPTLSSQIGSRVARERLQDLMLGFFLALINGFLIVGTLLSFLNAVHYGIAPDLIDEQQRYDQSGQPIVDDDGNPVMDTVYAEGAVGIGGIVPPQPGSTSAKLLPYLPPEIIQKSNAVLYIAVAASFVFVIVVFI